MRAGFIALLARWFTVTLAVCLSFSAYAAPYRPGSDEVLLKLDGAVQRAAQARSVHELETARSDPVFSAARAHELIELGRMQNDERYFGYASAVLEPWGDGRSAPVAIAELRADIAQHQHRFIEAKTILDALLLRDPHDANARLMRAATLMTLAQPWEAQKDCRELLSLRETFAGSVCAAQVGSLTGRLSSSYALVKLLLQHSVNDSSREHGWAAGIAGEMAERAGNLDAATRWFEKAMEITPTDLVSRLQLCDVLLRRGEYSQVMTILDENMPSSEPVLLRRALAGRHLDERIQRATLAAWQSAAAQSRQLGVRLHLRELAQGELELLNLPRQALTTALQNWEIQREPADARILFAAAKAANDQTSLEKIKAWQQEMHLEDAMLLR